MKRLLVTFVIKFSNNKFGIRKLREKGNEFQLICYSSSGVLEGSRDRKGLLNAH